MYRVIHFTYISEMVEFLNVNKILKENIIKLEIKPLANTLIIYEGGWN